MASQKIRGSYDVIVIGSGMSGLACACILGRLGRRVLVLEQHDRPGGCLHTFQSSGYTFSSGNHYIGEMDEVSQLLIRTCGSHVSPCKDPIVETYIRDGEKKVLYSGNWEQVMQCSMSKVKRMADLMWWIAFIKLVPEWLALMAWYMLKICYSSCFLPYDTWMKQHYSGSGEGWWTMQEGDVGCQPIAMVGAAVSRHYMHGRSTLSDTFVYDCCKTIRRQNGSVVVKHRVQDITSAGVWVVHRKKRFFVPANKVISSVGLRATSDIARMDDMRSLVKRIGDSVKHHFVFMGVKGSRETCGLPAGVVWIREGKQYMFVSSECVKDKISVHLIADEGTMTSQEMVALLYKYYPKVKSRVSFLDDATPYSVNKYLGRYASYGLSCEKRFSDYKLVRALRPATSSPNLFVTGQDILMPGIVSALSTALMTCRQVEGVTLWDTITKNDIADRLSA